MVQINVYLHLEFWQMIGRKVYMGVIDSTCALW